MRVGGKFQPKSPPTSWSIATATWKIVPTRKRYVREPIVVLILINFCALIEKKKIKEREGYKEVHLGEKWIETYKFEY